MPASGPEAWGWGWPGHPPPITPAFSFQLACGSGRGHFRCGELVRVEPGMSRGTESDLNRPHLPTLAPLSRLPLFHTQESATEEVWNGPWVRAAAPAHP